MALTPKDVDNVMLAFPAGVMKDLLPKWEDIPAEFKRRGGTKWNKVMSDWFYRGLHNAKWMPKPGVDTDKALRHVQACLGSWEPPHEHKEAGVAYLLSEFFEDVTYERGKLPT